MKDIVKDVLQRGSGVKDVAYIKEITDNLNIFEIQQRLSRQTHAGAHLSRCLSRRLSAKLKQEHVFHNVFRPNPSAKHILAAFSTCAVRRSQTNTSRLPNQQRPLRHSRDPTLKGCDKWLCGVWARGLSLDAIHMARNLTSAPPPSPPKQC